LNDWRHVDAPVWTAGRPSPGWQVAAVCLLMAVAAWGVVFYGHSVYMAALQQTRGWSASLISTAIMVFWLCSIPGLLAVGQVVDRRGPVPVLLAGALATGFGVIALGQVREPWQLFAVYAVMGAGYPALGAAGISAALVPWFDRRFGFVLGLALTGASLGGAVVPPVMVAISASAGFAQATLFAGIVTLAVLLPAAWLLARAGRPARAGSGAAAGTDDSRAALAMALRQPRFWRIAIGAALGLAAQSAFLAHQIPMLLNGLGAAGAALSVTLVALSAAAGRVAVGLLSRHLTAARLTALCYLLQAAGFWSLIWADSALTAYAACLLAGFVVGAIVMLPPILVRETFGITGYGRIYTSANVVLYVGAALGPWSAGLVRDWSGDYGLSLWLLIALHLGAACFFVTLRRA
jgi:predicted MFS family arabinose efflux permease